MSFQTIFEIQQSMNVQNRRMIGQQVTRAGYMTVAQYLTAVPWMFTVTPHNYLYYPTARTIIQTIDNKDRQLPETIQFNSNNLSWFTEYQGDASVTPTTIQLNAAPAANATTIVLKGLPSMSSAGALFRAGDFIMIEGYTYKVTTTVLRGSAATVSVTIHRPIIGSPVANTAVSCGNNCTFTVVAQTCPTYTLTPMADGAFVNWDEAFTFREYIT
jgi:hypothetical protein